MSRFIKTIIRSIIPALALPLCACTGAPTQSENADDYLTPSELTAKSQQAHNGNVEAALSVANYYLYWQNDTSAGISWLRVAAHGGEPSAMYGLGKLLANSSNPAEREESTKWLTEAAKHGFPPPTK